MRLSPRTMSCLRSLCQSRPYASSCARYLYRQTPLTAHERFFGLLELPWKDFMLCWTHSHLNHLREVSSCHKDRISSLAQQRLLQLNNLLLFSSLWILPRIPPFDRWTWSSDGRQSTPTRASVTTYVLDSRTPRSPRYTLLSSKP